MALKKRKRAHTPTGRPAGRPRKHLAADLISGVDFVAPSSDTTIDTLIANATTQGSARATAIDDLAATSESGGRAEVFSGPVHDAPRQADDKALVQLSQQVAGLTVVLFGIMALWRGSEWAVNEEEAGLVGDATASSYADDFAELAGTVKWVSPMMALIAIGGRKAIAESERRKRERESVPRALGLAPSDG